MRLTLLRRRKSKVCTGEVLNMGNLSSFSRNEDVEFYALLERKSLVPTNRVSER
jgi:hypothetical protein